MNNAMIEFRHVSKSFSRKGHPVLALQDINLSIERGDIFGIIGYSGAGKSTLLRLINRLENTWRGRGTVKRQSRYRTAAASACRPSKDIGMIFAEF
ncbi:ATP-binding cassette domain-containing protein [Klebsiella pneumoniae subsp. pneumoniae]|nr:ATP-binding cassette domain-containing protein [Klebsiella pneumoniae subsp. pneumoniae]